MRDVGLTGYGWYVPEGVLTGEEIAQRCGIPEEVVIEKMGLREKRVCPPDDDHCTDMAIAAARDALSGADVAPADLDMVLYHGSEYKDYDVWSAAADIAHRLGAENAFATENYTLCAGYPVALRHVRGLIRSNEIDRALLVTASREEDLVDYTDESTSFMFNFGSGAAASVLEGAPDPDRTRGWIRGSHAITDGSFAQDVYVPAGGSKHPPSEATVAADMHSLRVPDQEGMKERLGPVSLPNYLAVADTALERSGCDRGDVDFVAVTHMKRSFHETLVTELGLDPDKNSFYLDEYGHVQSADQIVALEEGRRRGRVEPGDVVLLLAAGTGYTWAATVCEWRG